MTIPSITMLPYNRQGEIDYASLEFNPDEPPDKPDAMEQHLEQAEVFQLLSARFTEFNQRPDVFLDFDSYICYDRNNLNVRVSPDIYLVFGVDARAIRPRKLYLPWEVGKPPDWVLEIASESTSRVDVNRKPGVYAQIGVPEYWRFDPTGGRYHGEPLAGGRLVNDVYRPVELTTEPDGILKGYSEVLELSLSWDEGWPRLYDPKTGAYLENWQQQMAAAEVERAVLEAERDAARAENERLREELRRLQSEN
jgi:Uma2 family endonuclease